MLAYTALTQAVTGAIEEEDVPAHVAAKLQGLLRPLGSQLRVELEAARSSAHQLNELHRRVRSAEAAATDARENEKRSRQVAEEAEEFRMKHGVLLELMGEREEEVERLKQALDEQREVFEIQIEGLSSRLVEQVDEPLKPGKDVGVDS